MLKVGNKGARPVDNVNVNVNLVYVYKGLSLSDYTCWLFLTSYPLLNHKGNMWIHQITIKRSQHMIGKNALCTVVVIVV